MPPTHTFQKWENLKLRQSPLFSCILTCLVWEFPAYFSGIFTRFTSIKCSRPGYWWWLQSIDKFLKALTRKKSTRSAKQYASCRDNFSLGLRAINAGLHIFSDNDKHQKSTKYQNFWHWILKYKFKVDKTNYKLHKHGSIEWIKTAITRFLAF